MMHHWLREDGCPCIYVCAHCQSMVRLLLTLVAEYSAPSRFAVARPWLLSAGAVFTSWVDDAPVALLTLPTKATSVPTTTDNTANDQSVM